MTVQEFLTRSTATLTRAGIASARLDAIILLEDALGQDRARLLAHPELEIPPQTEVALSNKIAQRRQHTPLAYIRGKTEFYGREFSINEHVLVPRPETETMIDLLKKLNPLPSDNKLVIADIGTGSGVIAVTAKLTFPAARVIATDIDPETLKIARQNAKHLGAKIDFLEGNLLEPLADCPVSIILANLPYVPERYAINQAAQNEPKHAIFGGKDGLDLYRQLWQQIVDLPDKPTFVLAESLPPQHPDLVVIAQEAGYLPGDSQDFIQVFKRG